MDYIQKCRALILLPLDKQLLINIPLDKQLLFTTCVLMQEVVHGKTPQYLRDLMIPSERLHVHGNKQLAPRAGTDIF